jgi:hypothetical protein
MVAESVSLDGNDPADLLRMPGGQIKGDRSAIGDSNDVRSRNVQSLDHPGDQVRLFFYGIFKSVPGLVRIAHPGIIEAEEPVMLGKQRNHPLPVPISAEGTRNEEDGFSLAHLNIMDV